MRDYLTRLKQLVIRFRTVFCNISFRVGGQIAAKLLGLVSVPIIARALGPEMYGQWNEILLISQYALIPVNFGFLAFGVRKIAQKDDPNVTIRDITSARVVLGSLSVALFAIVILIVYNHNPLMLTAALVGLAIVLARAINPEFYFFGVKKMLAPTLSQTISFALYVLLVALFVRSPGDLLILSIAYTINHLSMAAISLMWLPSDLRIRLWFGFKRTFRLLKQCYKLGISNLVDGLIPTIPRLLLTTMYGSYELGIYSAAGKFSSVIMLVYVGVGQAVGPYLVKLQSFPIPKRRKYLLGMSAIALGAGLLVGGGMFLFGEFLVLLIFGKSFGESVVVFKLLSLTWVTQMPLSLMLNNTVLFLGYDSELTKNRLITFVSCIVLSILFIYLWGTVGTVLATSVPLLMSNLLYIHFFYRQYFRKNKQAAS